MNRPLTILHAADLHLDSPFDGLSEEGAALRRRELRLIPGTLIHLAAARNADVILLAGDMFDSDEPYRDSVDELFRALGSVDIPVFISPGNHDFFSLSSPYAGVSLPKNVHVFTGGMDCVTLPELNLRVWGAAFTSEHSSSLLDGFRVDTDDGYMNIAVIHGDATNPTSPYGAVTAGQIAESGLNYLALGHNHAFSGLKRSGNTYYAWPGCCAGRGFDETGEKGACIVTCSPDSCALEFVPLGNRRYEILTVDITDSDAVKAILTALPENPERDLFRVILTGETVSPPDIDSIRHALEGRLFFIQLRDATVRKRDIWAGRGEDTLKGIFLSRLHDMLSFSDEDQRRKIELAAGYGLAALENGEAPALFRK